MKITFLCAVIAAAVLLVSATVWEGVTDVGSSKDMPETYSIATNSFPRNTAIDVTNLENGKMVRVIVTSGLETTGLLSTLSPSAADAIDLRRDSTCRIRITQPSDNASRQTSGSSRPHYGLGSIDTLGGSAFAPESEVVAVESALTMESVTTAENASVAENAPIAAQQPLKEGIIAMEELPAINDVSAMYALPAFHEPSTMDNIIAADEPDAIDNHIAAGGPAGAVPAEAGDENQSQPRMASGALTLVPTHERIPTTRGQPVPPSRTVVPGNMASKKDAMSKDTTPRGAPSPAAYAPPTDFSPFQAPLISSLAPGKWYVQLGVYSRPDNVEDEISRIGTAYPVAIQNVGTDTSPIFRVLLGPLNQGESGAMLQRFKSIGYNDAFIRHN